MAGKVKLYVNVYDGSRRYISNDIDLLVTIRDGMQKVLVNKETYNQPAIEFSVPFNDNAADNYNVVVFADDHREVGFYPIKVSKNYPAIVDLMLIPNDAGLDFTEARWGNLEEHHEVLFKLLSAGATGEAAKKRYEDFKKKTPGSLAAFFNVATAARDVTLPVGKALSYFKEMIWDEERMGEDRFFVFADEALVTQIKQAAAQGAFESQPGLDINHPGATCSYKQKQFGEANIQFSFHEKTKKTIGSTPCVKLELDMDYHRDFLAHTLLEVLPNKLTKGKTDPRQIYVLRWIAGRSAFVPEFDPPYTVGPLG